MKLPKAASAKVHRYLSDPRFKKEFDTPYKVDRSCDIPYVAGYSNDDKTIFIDRHYKKMMGNINTEPYIFVHEKCEKALIDIFGLKYQDAHHIATHLERMTIDRDGIDWDKYEHFVTEQYKHIGYEKVKKIPHNLDLTPYKDEHDFKIMKELQNDTHKYKDR